MEKFFRLSHVRVVAALAVFAMLVLSTSAFAQEMEKDKGMMHDKMMDAHTSSVFKGVKVNHGTVTHGKKDGKTVLTLSVDFEMPQTPDPHWQVVDSKGTVYLLDRLTVKPAGMAMGMKDMEMKKDEMGMKKDEMGMKKDEMATKDDMMMMMMMEKAKMNKNEKFNQSIVLPPYIKDVVKVQIWCAWAETLLGEASFQKALK